jgi:trimethylamine--corrinoid protein Co-methyltransferase
MTRSNFTAYGSPMFRQMSEDQLQAIHFASLNIIERTGMRFYDEEAIRLFKKAGAHVDDGNRVHIPSHLVEWALGIVPKRVTLYNLDGRPSKAILPILVPALTV